MKIESSFPIWKARGLSVSDIARKVGVHKSTISRELRRNARAFTREDQIFWLGVRHLMSGQDVLKYLDQLQPRDQPQDQSFWCATDAQRTRAMRLLGNNQLRRRKRQETARWVIQKLKESWSPEQIAGRSKLNGPEPVRHECVYSLLYEQKKKGPRIPGRKSIEERPSIADRRERLGDLEGDLIQGYLASGYVLSLIDRKSRYTILRKLPSKRKKIVRIQLERAIRKMGHAKTLTVDNGCEFADHLQLTSTTKVPVYFAQN